MHERSLVKSLLKQVDEICRHHGGRHVTEVRVEVGSLSGIEPILLATAYELLAPNSLASEAKLVIDEIGLHAQCKSCRCDFEVKQFTFICPECGGNVRITRGDELTLVSVSLQDEAPIQELMP